MSKTTPAICPFTLKSLATSKAEDVAIIYERNPLIANNELCCGHSCTLSHLVPYLHNSGGSKTCPVCQSSPANIICDAKSSTYLEKQKATTQNIAATEMLNDAPTDKAGRIVTFRYGTTVYFLWVSSETSGRKANTLDRIGLVLGMDVNKGMKVIHKGKVLFPDLAKKNESPDDTSEQLLDISSADIIHCRKKPSLVVIGLRSGQLSNNKSMGKQTTKSILYSIGSMFTPWYIWNAFQYSFVWTYRTTKSLLGGIYLFVKSLLYPPQ